MRRQLELEQRAQFAIELRRSVDQGAGILWCASASLEDVNAQKQREHAALRDAQDALGLAVDFDHARSRLEGRIKARAFGEISFGPIAKSATILIRVKAQVQFMGKRLNTISVEFELCPLFVKSHSDYWTLVGRMADYVHPEAGEAMHLLSFNALDEEAFWDLLEDKGASALRDRAAEELGL